MQNDCVFICGAMVVLAVVAPVSAQSESVDRERVLVIVDDSEITESDFEFYCLSRRIPNELREKQKRVLLEQLIERELIRAFLAQRKTEADPELLDQHVQRMKELIAASGEEPAQVLTRLGYTEERLRAELALPLAWRRHLRRVMTPNRIREYFRDHLAEFDGTTVRSSHIVIKVSADADEADWLAAEEKLESVLQSIRSGKVSFEEAVKTHSEGPSAQKDGDVGFYPFRGRMPSAFADATFSLKVGEMTGAFRTPFGVHLAKVTDRKPGLFSLEDVRAEVLDRLSKELWNETVDRLRKEAKIEWTPPE